MNNSLDHIWLEKRDTVPNCCMIYMYVKLHASIPEGKALAATSFGWRVPVPFKNCQSCFLKITENSITLFFFLCSQANLMIHLKGVRDEHIKYTAELARYSNEVTTTYKETPRTDQENRSDLSLHQS
jgi:hypothetical protein